MIISHRHRFIFIKNRKVAGTSIEKALHEICGPEDVLTPDHLHSGEHDELLATSRNYHGRFNPLPELLAAGARMASSILALKRFRLEDESLYQRIDNQRRSQASPEI